MMVGELWGEFTIPHSSVRVEDDTLVKLRAISKDETRPIGQIVTDRVKRYEKEKFWQEMHTGFARLRQDPVTWQEDEVETTIWDSTSDDGLENEESYYSPEEEEEIKAEDTRPDGR